MLNITSPELVEIISASGNHKKDKTNADVVGIKSILSDKNIKFFPKGLEKIFKFLKVISIRFGRLNQIHQSDLKPFPLLEILDLHENDILVIEYDLFDFNPNLKEIWISNKIKHVDVGAFDSLNNLVNLYLFNIKCIDTNATNNRSAVMKLIETAENSCFVSSYDRIRQKRSQKKLKMLESFLNYDSKLKITNSSETQNAAVSKKISELSHKIDDFASEVDRKLQILAWNFYMLNNNTAENRTDMIVSLNFSELNVNDNKFYFHFHLTHNEYRMYICISQTVLLLVQFAGLCVILCCG